ncbi:hypothetical protein JCM6882_005084 [Rhodosporidiobolus microsporus]
MDFGKLAGMAKSAYNAYEDSQNKDNNNNNQQQSYGQNDSSNSPYPQQSSGGYGGNSGSGGEAQGYYSGGNSGSSNSPYPQQPQQGSGHYGSGGGQFGVQGGSQFNDFSGNNGRPSGCSGGGGASGLLSFLNDDEVVNKASNQSNEDSGLFSKALSFLKDQADDDDDIDENQAQQAHQQAYGQGNGQNLNSKDMGSAAALQALKGFIGGGNTQQQNQGGDFKAQLISKAMAEAAKLFDQNGGAAGGAQKQDVVNQAGKMMLKLMVKNQVSGAIGGGSEGGMGQLLSLAQGFMK